MTGKALCFWVRCAIIAIAICGGCVCAFWYPFSISLATNSEEGFYAVAYWVQLLFYLMTSLPCFFVLVIGWEMTTAIKDDSLFQQKNARLAKIAMQILFMDSAVFLLGNIVFLGLGWNNFVLLYFLFAIIGLVVGVFMAILSHYLYKAAILQEECEGII